LNYHSLKKDKRMTFHPSAETRSPSEIIAALCAKGHENEVVEFKEAKTSYDPEKLGKYFSALSNEANLQEQGRAWLVFGVKDQGAEIIGSQYRRETAHLMKIKEEIANQTTGNLTFTRIHEETVEGKRILLFEIPAAPQGIPIAWKRHFYGRDNEALVGLNLNELETIRSQRSINDWSVGLCPEASLADLDPAAIEKARAEYLIKNPNQAKEIPEWDAATFLNKAKLTINGQITRTVLLLLGKPESEHYLSPAVFRMTWLLKDKDGIEKDYEHFGLPLILSVEKILRKIRRIRYRYMLPGTIFPEEVEQYDSYLIREALHNAVAHQDYELGGRIILVENENDSLIFVDEGSFLPGSAEAVIEADAPSTNYRNQFLVAAMVNLNLIDTIGSGIKKMFRLQRERFFPMPEYNLEGEKVAVTIQGKVLDVGYATKLALMPELGLRDIVLLDKVQKRKALTSTEIQHLKRAKLIEGRKPNFHISTDVASKTEQEVDYMKQRGIDNDYCRTMILKSLKSFKSMSRSQFEEILSGKLSETLSEKQKSDKIRNVLQALRREDKIRYCENDQLWESNPQTELKTSKNES